LVTLFEQDIKTNDRQSSKGNQLKWENDGIWYKADYAGYEGLAEYMISNLLQKSSLLPEEYAVYQTEQIRYKDVVYTGCASRNFLRDSWQIITLERLYKNVTNKSLTQAVWTIRDVRARFQFLVSETERITGLKRFDIYLNKLFTIDAFFLNEDRHLHNIAVLMNDKGEFRYSPVFDNGAGLLSDITMDYPLSGDVYQLMDSVRAKTVSPGFDEQLDVSEEAAGHNLGFYFQKQDVLRLLQEADAYPEAYRNRVRDILFWQMKKYRYLFGEKEE